MEILPIYTLNTGNTANYSRHKINRKNQYFCGNLGFGNAVAEADMFQLTKQATANITEKLTNISVWQQVQKYFQELFGDRD